MNSELQTLVSLDPLTTIPDEATQEIISLLRSGIEARVRHSIQIQDGEVGIHATDDQAVA